MSWWAWTIVVVATFTGLTVLATVRPWAPCRACDGYGTVRGARGRWSHHCPDCLGYGTVERHLREFLREATGKRLFPSPPERTHGDRQTYGGWAPFAGRRWGGGARRGWRRGEDDPPGFWESAGSWRMWRRRR